MSSDISPLATSAVSEPPAQAAHHVLMLVNTHVYDDPRVIAEAESLVEAGYAVHIVGAARQGGLPVKDTVRGMDILLTPMVTESRALLRALWRWLRGDLDPGATTETPRNLKTNLASLLFFNLWSLRAGLMFPAEVIHAHDLSPLPAAWLLARWRHARLIYDSHESAPDFYTGVKGRLAARLEKALIGKPEAVITVGERLARALRERGARRVLVVGNWKRLERFEPDPPLLAAKRRELGLDRYRLVVSYIGTLETDRAIQPLLEAVEQSPHVCLLIGGRGSQQAVVEAAAARSANIHWLGWVDSVDIPTYTHLSDAVYYCLNVEQSRESRINLGNNYYSAPNKLFEAFAAGKAIIARRGVGEIGEILERIPAGILLDEATPDTLKAAFQQLGIPDTLKALQQAALAGREQYHWGAAEARLRQLYEELTQ
jgi:glycosyltransferase involved in cell wall biosynthesis